MRCLTRRLSATGAATEASTTHSHRLLHSTPPGGDDDVLLFDDLA